MQNMQKILILLIAIKQFIKQYHWQATSYQDHLLGDRLLEDIEDYIDETAELSVLFEGKEPLAASVLLGKASLYLSGKGNATLEEIAKAFGNLSDELTRLSANTDDNGLKDLFGRLSNTVLRKLYLIQTQGK